MKIKKIELDVDFIGGQGGLTPDEEKALSEFFQNRKSNVKLTKKKKLENKIEQPMPIS
jgi:hypothetical protein